MDWSYAALCSPEEQVLWPRLSVFADTFDASAAEAVCGWDGIAPGDVPGLLDALVDSSILTVLERSGRVRYRMLGTIRQYGHDRLSEPGQATALRQRHRDWYLSLVAGAEAEWYGPKQLRRFSRLRLEHAELQRALELSLAAPDRDEAGLLIASSLWIYWTACGLIGEGRGWLDRALRSPTGPSRVRAKALWAAGWLAAFSGDAEAAVRLAADSRLLAGQLHDASGLAYAAHVSGLAAALRGDLAAAEACFDEALAGHRAVGDRAGVQLDLGQQALVASLRGDTASTTLRYEQSRAAGEQNGESWHLSELTLGEGMARWRQGETERPGVLVRDSLRVKASLDDSRGIALCAEVLAWIAQTEGHSERAARLLGSAQAIARTTGEPMFGFRPLMADHDRCETLARRALGDTCFQAAFGEGARLAVDAAVAEALRDHSPQAGETARVVGAASAQARLTRREAEIAGFAARGLTNKDIAAALVISQRTVEAHIDHILGKLGFSSRAQIAAWVAEHHAASGE